MSRTCPKRSDVQVEVSASMMQACSEEVEPNGRRNEGVRLETGETPICPGVAMQAMGPFFCSASSEY